MKVKSQVCPECNITVAPQAPDRMVVGSFVFHTGCFKKHLKKTQLSQALQLEEVVLKTNAN